MSQAPALERRSLDFVVTGTPRSGTQYVARVLRSLGLDCWHERSFNPWGIVVDAYRLNDRPWGDSSWLAVPFLDLIPASTKVLHVVREPLSTINSMIGTRHFNHPRPGDFQKFLGRHCWNDENHRSADVGEDAQTFWVEWNRRIEESGRVFRRFQVEAIGGVLPAVMSELGGARVTQPEITRVLQTVPTTVNTRERLMELELTRSDLTPACLAMAARYGYAY